MSAKGQALIAYADCFSGVSGDMFLGALIDAGLEIDLLQAELEKLGLEDFRLRSSKIQDHAISATRLQIDSGNPDTPRSWKDIRILITHSGLPETIKGEISPCICLPCGS